MDRPTDRPSAPAAAATESYERWRADLRANPDYGAIYAEEAVKGGLGLALAEARHQAGLSREELARRLGLRPEEVERIEEGDADAYPLATLRRSLAALGQDYTLVVRVQHRESEPHRSAATG